MIDYYVSALNYCERDSKYICATRCDSAIYVTVKRVSSANYSHRMSLFDFLEFSQDIDVYGFSRFKDIKGIHLYQFWAYSREYLELESYIEVHHLSPNFSGVRTLDCYLDSRNELWFVPSGLQRYSMPFGYVVMNETPVTVVEYIIKFAESIEPDIKLAFGSFGSSDRVVNSYKVIGRGRALLAKLRLLQ